MLGGNTDRIEQLWAFSEALKRGEDPVEARVLYLDCTPEFARRVQEELEREHALQGSWN